VVVVAGTLLLGCDERSLAAGAPCTHGQSALLRLPRSQSLDLLVVIDSSASMAEEQRSLAAELPRLVEGLASGDLDGDGGLELVPFSDVHVGVITGDLGSGPVAVPTCRAGLGDDAILRSSRGDGRPCDGVHPHAFFSLGPSATVGSAERAVSCLVDVGTSGCGFQQPLEAALKALTPVADGPWTADGYEVPRFHGADGTPDLEPGHGDGLNDGFLRYGTLAVLLLTDEDDCSVRDYSVYDRDDPRFADTPPDLRCARAADDGRVLQAIERYVEGLSGLRRDPGSLVFGAIVGVPTSLESVDDLGAALDDARMRRREDAGGARLVPSCTSARGEAVAPVRLLETARGLEGRGAQVSVASICADTFGPGLDAFADAVARTQPFGCLPRPLPRRADGFVDCSLWELLPEGQRCDDVPARSLEDVVVDDGGRAHALCRVAQVPHDGAEPGWFYDDSSARLCGAATPFRLAFVDGAEPRSLDVRMVCAERLSGADSGLACVP
jgi:hypothetical protein